MSLPKAIRDLRRRIGSTQQKFATDLGISIRALANYEKDRDPPIGLLLKLATLAKHEAHSDLTRAFEVAFNDRLRETAGQEISVLHHFGDESTTETAPGLLMLSIPNIEFWGYAWGFYEAWEAALKRGDQKSKTAMKRLADEITGPPEVRRRLSRGRKAQK